MISSQVDNYIGLHGDSCIGGHGESLKKLNKSPDIGFGHDVTRIVHA